MLTIIAQGCSPTCTTACTIACMEEGACALSCRVCAEHADPDDPLRVTDDTRFLGLIVSGTRCLLHSLLL